MVAGSWFRSLWRTEKKHEAAGPEKAMIGILAFEVSSLMSKMVHLWRYLSDNKVASLRENISNSEGIKKLVSDDDDYIVGLIRVELFEKIVDLAKSVARLAKKYCSDPSLKGFEHAISDWINNGVDPYGWELSRKKMEMKAKKMQKFISRIANLCKEMKILSNLEETLEFITASLDGEIVLDFEQKVARKRQVVENLKEVSLWNRTFDDIVLLLATSLFTIFGRIKKFEKDSDQISHRSHSVSSVHPSIFSYKHKLLDAPPETLGAAALALHYANVVIKIENLVPFFGLAFFSRVDLYNMLPTTVRDAVRVRLEPHNSKSLITTSSVYDAGLAGEWKEAVAGILEWLAPLAHNMISWKPKSRSVLLVQTLYFANQHKTEATITEIFVGLHYICKFGSKMRLRSSQIPSLQKDQNPAEGESNSAAADAKQQLQVLRTNLEGLLVQKSRITG